MGWAAGIFWYRVVVALRWESMDESHKLVRVLQALRDNPQVKGWNWLAGGFTCAEFDA
jgi:hypothetical protein